MCWVWVSQGSTPHLHHIHIKREYQEHTHININRSLSYWLKILCYIVSLSTLTSLVSQMFSSLLTSFNLNNHQIYNSDYEIYSYVVLLLFDKFKVNFMMDKVTFMTMDTICHCSS